MSATVERPRHYVEWPRLETSRRRSALSAPLELLIDDPEVIRALLEYSEGDARNQYAIEAMKIGVLALRHVGGQVSADVFRREGDRLVGGLQKTFDQHKNTVQEQIEDRLKEYFDPKDGRFTERVQRLVAQDGELSQFLKSYIDGENSHVRSHAAHPRRPR